MEKYTLVVGKAGDPTATKVRTNLDEAALERWLQNWLDAPFEQRADFYVEPFIEREPAESAEQRAFARLRELHREVLPGKCREDGQKWPCPTIDILAAAS